MKRLIILSTAAMILSLNALSGQEPEDKVDDISIYEVGFLQPNEGFGFRVGPGFGPAAMKKNKQMNKGRIFSEETEKKIIDIIAKNDSSFANKLLELKKSDKIKYNHFIRLSANFLAIARLDKSLEKDMVRGAILEFEARELAIKYIDAPTNEKEKIKMEIKSRLNELFDIRTKLYEFRLKNLYKRIEELKSELEIRKSNKSKIVERRFDELTSKRLLRW